MNAFVPVSTISALQIPKRRSLARRVSVVAVLLAAAIPLPVTQAADGGLPRQNTAEGSGALSSLTSGSDNAALGFHARLSNTTGFSNTASGESALASNTSGVANTATGESALTSNTTAGGNVADGQGALTSNTEGSGNVASGDNALFSNTTGQDNVASGSSALFSNTTGVDNTAVGLGALGFNDSGNFNIALGVAAGGNLTTGDNNIDIGNSGVADESGTIRIGTKGRQTRTFIAGISGVAVPGGAGVIVSSNGKLGTVVSSERFKDEIKPMDKASEAILGLDPVTFRYKHELDPDGIPQFGLVAEQVEKVNRDLVVRDEEGKAYTVRYDAVNAMLLNEFLKEHRKLEQLQRTVVQQQNVFQSVLVKQQKQIEALTAGLEEVRNELPMGKAAPPMIVGN
jgi:Chaperone of endosialidase